MPVSILPEQLNAQMIMLSGEPGSGKTTIALSLDFTENAFLIDCDGGKGLKFKQEFPGMAYIDIKGDTTVSYGKLIKYTQTIKDKTLVVIDDFVSFERIFLSYAMANPLELAKMLPHLDYQKIAEGSYGQHYAAADYLLKSYLALLAEKGIKTTIVISHLSSVFNQPGKFEIKGRSLWLNYSSLSLIILKTGGLSDAIVYKSAFDSYEKPDIKKLTKAQLQAMMRGEQPTMTIIRHYPPRIPEIDAAKIRHYLFNPIGTRDLLPNEMPRESEINAFSRLMTSDEREALLELIKQREAEEKAMIDEVKRQEAEAYALIVSKAKELSEASIPLPKIAAALNEEFGKQYTAADVIKMVK